MSDAPSSAVPAAWYPDPEGSPHQRYWDGTQWGNLDSGDFSAFAPNASSPAPPGFYPDPQGSPRHREWTGKDWGALEPPSVASTAPPPPPTPTPLAVSKTYVPPSALTHDYYSTSPSAVPPAPGYDAAPAYDTPPAYDTATSNLPPPGMYPDPEDPSRDRFWNGSDWSSPHHTHPPSKSLLGSLHLPKMPAFSGSRTKVLAGVLALILVAGGGYFFFAKGSGPTVPSTSAAFCADVSAYDSFNQTGATPPAARSANWSSRATALSGIALNITAESHQIALVSAIISTAPTSAITQAYTKAQVYNHTLAALFASARRAVSHLPARASRSRVQATITSFSSRIALASYAGAGAIAPVNALVASACPGLMPTSSIPAG